MGAAKLVTAKNDTAAKESAEALLQKQVSRKIFSLPLKTFCFWKYN